MRKKWDFFEGSNLIFFDEGPRSFFEYEYHDIRIILIGECLSSLSGKHPMPANYKNNFISVFNHWMEQCSLAQKRTLILLEQPEANEVDAIGFMDCIMQIKMPEGFKLEKSDARIMDDAFNEFGGFIFTIDRMCKEISPLKESLNFKSISSKALWNKKPLINEIKKHSKAIVEKMYLEDLKKHLQKQADLLKGILNQAEKHPKILPFITECHDATSNTCFKAFDEITAWCEKRNILHESLDAICIHMIEKYNNLSPIDTWSSLLCVDMAYSLNALLLSKLWNEMHKDNRECSSNCVTSAVI